MRGVRRTGWFLIPRCQTQSDGVDYAPKPRPSFSLPHRGIGMGLIEMPHSFQRTEHSINLETLLSYLILSLTMVKLKSQNLECIFHSLHHLTHRLVYNDCHFYQLFEKNRSDDFLNTKQ